MYIKFRFKAIANLTIVRAKQVMELTVTYLTHPTNASKETTPRRLCRGLSEIVPYVDGAGAMAWRKRPQLSLRMPRSGMKQSLCRHNRLDVTTGRKRSPQQTFHIRSSSSPT
ncbi:MAG: hypothetical protein J7L73_03875 [Anaerolineales bacterium]|nr:hypothetical protein [Anaerolineales bacterium]